MDSLEILSFEEFTSGRLPRYDNFFLHFARGVGPFYRNTTHYKQFEEENPALAHSLCEKIQQMDTSIGTATALKPFEPELYEAYKIMRSYGTSHEELFD